MKKLEWSYDDFEEAKNETCGETIDVGVGKESTKKREQESGTHEVGEGICSSFKIKMHHKQKVLNKACHICHKTHALKSQQSCSTY